MRTARSLPYMGVSVWGVSVQGGLFPGDGGVSVQGGGGGLCRGGALSGRPPPPVNRQTRVKIVSCPKLCFWTVTRWCGSEIGRPCIDPPVLIAYLVTAHQRNYGKVIFSVVSVQGVLNRALALYPSVQGPSPPPPTW